MQSLAWPRDAEILLARAEALADQSGSGGPRRVLGISGAPACGKSTLTDWLVAELQRRHPGSVAHVGMDGFHLGHAVLVARDQVEVKGAPQTFDALGYAALLQRVRDDADEVYAPVFHREIEDSIAHESVIAPSVRLVITEGNYLLLPDPPWDRVRPLLDDAWFVHLDDDERRRRLLERHLRYGHAPDEARARTLGSDEANAVRVNDSGASADLLVEVDPAAALPAGG